MTNYEWLVKEYPDLITDLIAGKDSYTNSINGIALKLDGTPCLCKSLACCTNCRFYIDSKKEKTTNCTYRILNWLKEKHIEYINVSNINELKEAFYKFKEEINSTHNVFTVVDIENFLDHIVITGGKENDKS